MRRRFVEVETAFQWSRYGVSILTIRRIAFNEITAHCSRDYGSSKVSRNLIKICLQILI